MRTLALILACASLAAADEVQLKGGGKVSGVVEELGDKVVVRMEHGSLTFPRDQIEQIDRAKSSPLQEYQQRLQASDLSRIDQVEALLKWVDQRKMANAARELRERLGRLRWDGLDQSNASQLEIYASWAQVNGLSEMTKTALKRVLVLRREKIAGGPADAEALYELGLWARSNNMSADALILFQEAINANPEHEFARRALGFQFYAGKWRTPTEVKIAMGLIEFEGDWMTPQAKEAILSSRTLEKERKLLEEARRKLEEERTLSRIEFERRKAELDARTSQIAERLAELELERRTLQAVVSSGVPVPVPVPVAVPVPVPVPVPTPPPPPVRPRPPLPR
jgi:hypothetical protein